MASVSRPTCRPLIETSARSRSVLEANSNDGSTAPAWTILASTEGLYPWASSLSWDRWGEKVPATDGTVGGRFVERERGPTRDQFAWSCLDRANLLACGTG